MRTIALRLWNSPTFTTWCSRVVSFGRLFLVLPLLLHRFDQVQVAAWLLFGSLTFFGTMIAMQAGMVFSRMFSVAMGGAADLSPIRPGEVRESCGIPNWEMIQSLYETLRSLNLAIAFVGLLLISLLGFFSLGPLLADYEHSKIVWFAFAAFVTGQFVAEAFRKYAITLRGLNHVALTNRWGILFSFLSVCAGVTVLLLGGNILALAITMQVFVVVGVLRQWFLLVHVVEPRFKKMGSWRLDPQILKWVWEPLWKGVVQLVANRGGARVGAVFLARNMDPVSLSGMLLAIRLLSTVEDFATAPITSHVPRLGRLLGEGKVDRFRIGILSKLRICAFLQTTGIAAIAAVGYFGLQLIGANTQMIPVEQFAVLAMLQLLVAQLRQTLLISIIGNNVVAVGRFLIAVTITISAAAIIIRWDPFWGFVLAVYLPVLFVVNLKPLKAACELMELPQSVLLKRSFCLPWICLLFLFALLLWLPWQNWSFQAAEFVRENFLNAR